MTGWSTSAVPSWVLSVTRYIDQPTTYLPTAMLDSNELNNGGTAKLTITIPADAPSGSYGILAVGSARSQTNYEYTLVGVYTP